jgi:hypothetical protein
MLPLTHWPADASPFAGPVVLSLIVMAIVASIFAEAVIVTCDAVRAWFGRRR